jgi:hypothetical protein
MTNYWLSNVSYQANKMKLISSMASNRNLTEEEEPEDEETPEDEENPDEDSEDEDDPESKLTDRQKALYEYYEDVVEEFGRFDKTSGPNGAHYAPASENPFKEKGLICGNCVYFKGGGGCEIVFGTIEANAICKLWIIPKDLLK